MGPRSAMAGGFASMATSSSEPDFDDLDVVHTIANCEQENKKITGKQYRDKKNFRTNRVMKHGQTSGRSHRSAANSLKATATKRNLPENSFDYSTTKVDATRQAQHDGNQLIGDRPGVDRLVKGSNPVWHSFDGKQMEQTTDTLCNSSQDSHDTKATGCRNRELEPAPLHQQSTPQRINSSEEQMLRACSIPQRDAQKESSTTNFLEDMQRKYHILEVRYNELRDIGIKAAEHNFERLRKQSEEGTAVSEKLIGELKQKITTQTALLQKMDEDDERLKRSEARAKELEDRIERLTMSLSQATSEIETLTAKLAASRAAQASANMTGITLKSGLGSSKPASTEATLAAQAREDLYGDLTGLIMRGNSRNGGEHVFDCIQTGRNGTLHFKLSLETGVGPDVYDDIQFTYSPQLDESRDGDLIGVLPNYLVEEITFTRTQASNFYSKLNKSLTQRISKED